MAYGVYGVDMDSKMLYKVEVVISENPRLSRQRTP